MNVTEWFEYFQAKKNSSSKVKDESNKEKSQKGSSSIERLVNMKSKHKMFNSYKSYIK